VNRATLLIGTASFLCRWDQKGNGQVTITRPGKSPYVQNVPMLAFKFLDFYNESTSYAHCHLYWDESTERCYLEHVTIRLSNGLHVIQEPKG